MERAPAARSSCLLTALRVELRRGTDGRRSRRCPLSFTSRAASSRPAHRRAIERGGEADALHAGRLQLGDGERLALDADHEVDRLRQRRAHRAHRREVGQARREQHVGAGLLEGLQPRDRVVEVRVAAQEVLRPRGQREREAAARAPPPPPPRRARSPGRRRRAAGPCRRWRPRSSRRPARPRRRGGSSPPRPPARRRSPSPDRPRPAGRWPRRWRARGPAPRRASPCRRAGRACRPRRRSTSRAPGSRARPGCAPSRRPRDWGSRRRPGASCSARKLSALSAWLVGIGAPVGGQHRRRHLLGGGGAALVGSERLAVAVDARQRRLEPRRLGARPMCSSISAAERIVAVGLAMPRPAMSGAEPWTDSK